MGPLFDKKRLSNSIQRTASIIKRAHLLSAISKKRVGGRGNQLTPKRSSGGNSTGNSRFLLSDFLLPKKNGKLRLIIDLSTLNKYVFVQSFRMETQRKVRNAIRQNDWAFSLDSTDAYLHVPIHPRSRKYLCFTLKGRVFHFRALPFSLSTSPYIFTLLMTVIATYLRRRAIILHPYLDDWLSRNQSRLILLEHRHFIIQIITSLGLIINQEKSDLIPTQMFTFIGMEFLTHMNIVRVPQAGVQILLETVKKFSQKTYVSAREFLSLLGQLNAAADFVMLGRLHLRPLQMSLLAQWRPQTLPLQHQIKLTVDVLHHLNWWQILHLITFSRMPV